jgi:hypothetical protein
MRERGKFHDALITVWNGLRLHVYLRGGASNIRDQISYLLVAEAVLPAMHPKERFALLDGLLEFDVVFDPRQVCSEVGGRNT